MNPENFFTAEEQERIQQAVGGAEKRTSGEIVPMIVNSSGRYGEIELGGVIAGLTVGTIAALIFNDPWQGFQTHLIWPIAAAFAGLVICSIPGIKRILISRDRVTEAVHLRSLAAFTAHGLHYTEAHTGILIYASLLEHRVVVLADKGINEKVSPGTWDEVVQILSSGIKSGLACDAFCEAIARCGDILAQHFPRASDDQDELPNRLLTDSE